jgi:hypothetical protein
MGPPARRWATGEPRVHGFTGDGRQPRPRAAGAPGWQRCAQGRRHLEPGRPVLSTRQPGSPKSRPWTSPSPPLGARAPTRGGWQRRGHAAGLPECGGVAAAAPDARGPMPTCATRRTAPTRSTRPPWRGCVSALHARSTPAPPSSTPRSWPLPTACCSSSWPPTRAGRLQAHAGRPAGLRPHRLGAETENGAGRAGRRAERAYMIYNRSKSGDLQFAPFTDVPARSTPTPSTASSPTSKPTPTPSVRRGAWASFSAGLKAYNQTYAATFATEVNKNVVLARLRGYPSTEAFLLQPHKIPHAVYNNILDIIQAEAGAPHAALCAAAPPRAGPGQAAVLRHQGAAGPGLQPASCPTRTAAS